MSPTPNPVGRGVERLAAWFSAACAVHCLLVPVASALVPLLSASFGAFSEQLEPVFNLLVLAGGLLSLVLGYRRHHDARLSIAIVLCLALYGLGHTLVNGWFGRGLAIFSGLGLAIATFISSRQRHASHHHNRLASGASAPHPR